jgi:hypothetical protein
MATMAEKLRALLDYLNSRCSNIQFTMDTEREMATCISWKLTATEEKIAPWVTKYTENQPKQICN